MKSLLPFLLALFNFMFDAHAGQSFLYPMIGPMQIPCCSQANYSIDVKNVNPTFAIHNINGTFVVTRQSKVIFEQTTYPRQQNLAPNTTITFAMEIPGELLLLDGLLEIYFEFGSDFDLNPDPTQSNIAEVLGCGMTQQQVTDFFLEGFFASAEAQEAYLFLYQQLLKPGTVIHGSYLDSYSTTVDAFTWLALIYDPFKRFSQPIQVILADANTGETEIIEANFPPVVSDQSYVPEVNSPDRISGNDVTYPPPPASFDFTAVPSIPQDSVCAILVSGVDYDKPSMQQSFINDNKLMQDYLTMHPNGPRLPASSVLTRHVKDGYSKDSLLMDLLNLRNKYKKVYFYYSGHASYDGELILGKDGFGLLSREDFANDLLLSGAESYCILIDACYSGKILEAVCNDPKAQGPDIEMVTSSSRLRTSRIEAWTINNMEQNFGMYTSHFFFAIQDNTNDKNLDGKVSLTEGFKEVFEVNLNNISNLQLPMMKDIKNFTVRKLGERIRAAAVAAHGEQKVDGATITVDPNLHPDGTVIQSFDQATTYTLNGAGYAGMIEWEPNALFQKPVTYVRMAETTFDIDFEDIPTSWPTLPYCPTNPWDPEHVFRSGIDYLTGQPLNSIHDEVQTPGPPLDKTKAIIISGWHPDPNAQHALSNSGSAFRDNLTKETSGLQLHEDNINFQPFISGPALTTYLNSLQHMDHILFYFNGNMSAQGDVMLGTLPEERMNLLDLFFHLDNIDAQSYTIFLDASHSGIALEILQSNQFFVGKNLDLISSANATNPAYFNIWVDDQMNMTGAETAATYHFLQLYGDPAYDTDSYPGVSFKESFNALFKQNPIAHNNTPLFELSQPVNYVVRLLQTDATSTGTHVFPDLDLQVRFEPRNLPFAVSAAQELRTEDQVIAHADIFVISPSRRWSLTGSWDVDPSLQADLIFGYDPDIDLLDGTDGVIGLVSRLSSGDEWEPYFPVQYNEDAQTITAMQVTGPRQWAIARVREPVGLSAIRGLTNLIVYPNPVHDEIKVSIDLEQSMNVIVRILDITGQLHYSTRESFPQGRQVHTVRMHGLMAGMYCLEFVSDHGGTANKLFVIR